MQAVLPAKTIENIFFKKHLRGISSARVDDLIHHLYQQVSQQIDCTTCANCCIKLEPGIDTDEITALAECLKLEPEKFKQHHVGFDGTTAFLKTKPCLFLKEYKCNVYELRPRACSGYPHLDEKDMKYKSSLWANYSICPIVFNVVEALKVKLDFTNHAQKV